MATPIVEQIAVALKTAVEQVTTGNGYEVTLADVVRPKARDGYDPQHLLAVLQQEETTDPQDGGIFEGNPPMRVFVETFTVDAIIMPPDNTEWPIDKWENIVRSDIEKAIAVGFVAGGTLDGLTRGFTVGPPQRFEEERGDFEGIRLVVDVTYGTDEDDPYTSR